MITNSEILSSEAVVITLDQAKDHLNIERDFTDQDALIQVYIDAAVSASENYIGGPIGEKAISFNLDGFENPIILDAFPVIEIESVKYYGFETSEEITMDDGLYVLTNKSSQVPAIRFNSDLPVTAIRFDAVTIIATCGYAADTVPAAIISAILLQLADLYERREDRTEILSTAAMSLLRPYKKF